MWECALYWSVRSLAGKVLDEAADLEGFGILQIRYTYLEQPTFTGLVVEFLITVDRSTSPGRPPGMHDLRGS